MFRFVYPSIMLEFQIEHPFDIKRKLNASSYVASENTLRILFVFYFFIWTCFVHCVCSLSKFAILIKINRICLDIHIKFVNTKYFCIELHRPFDFVSVFFFSFLPLSLNGRLDVINQSQNNKIHSVS